MVEKRISPLLPGDHVLEETIEGCQIVAFDAEHDLAKLVLSIKSHRPQGRGASRPSTTLAIHIDRRGLMKLLVDLHNLSNSKGWPLEHATGGRAGLQTVVHSGPHPGPRRSDKK